MNEADSGRTASDVSGRELGPTTLFVFALATGAFAGNLYLAQPLIELIGRDLNMSTATLGFIVMLTQIGYAMGMFFVGPVGDVVENRRIILASVLCVIISLLAVGLSVSPAMFLIASFVVGLSAVGTQVIVPLAANLATDEKRGAQIGTIMAGLLGGIMLARPASSYIASQFGWRAPFLAAALLMACIFVMLWLKTPRYQPKGQSTYGSLIKTMIRLPVTSEALRRRAIYQAIVFAVFNMFWTSSSLVLTESFSLNYEQIALFALAGAGGALAAPYAGKLADRGFARIASGGAIAIILVCMALSVPIVNLTWLIAFAILGIVIDAATQANQVLGQATIYAALPEARARANAFYMTSLFVGGAFGSMLAPICFDLGGWPMLVGAASVLLLLALVYWASEYLSKRSIASTKG